MKIFKSGVTGAVVLLLASAIHTFGIEKLKVSLLSSNAVLSWPSTNYETYIVQYRSNMNAAASWLTLTDSFPAAASSNLTFFIHSNIVIYPPNGSGGTNGGGGIPDPGNTNGAFGSTNSFPSTFGFYQVVRDGAHIYGLTNNSTLSGEVQMPIEIAVNSTNQISSVTFYNSADDSPVIGASAFTNSTGRWIFDWNTRMVSNGSNNIYAEVDFITDNPVTSSNLPVSINISNIISFPNYFTRIFGGQMWLYAETIPNAAYQIDMYDDSNSYFGSFGGSADGSGVISFLWDLTDGNGYTFTSTNFTGVFGVTFSLVNIQTNLFVKGGSIGAGSPTFHKLVKNAKGSGVRPNGTGSSSATQTWAVEGNWGSYDKFAVAYAPVNDSSTTTFRISEMMVGGDGGQDGGVVSALANYGFGYQLSPGNTAQSAAFQMASSTDRSNLLSYLADANYRNFYFFGHGNADVIAAYNTAETAITSRTIANKLGNFLSGSKPENFHPYRLVFIDGCNTGKGKFCEAFGIPAQTANTNYFANANVRSRAFLGFKKEVLFNEAQWDWRSIMLGGFFADWMSGLQLQFCVGNAQAGIHSSYFQKMDSSAVIYGAIDLTKNSP